MKIILYLSDYIMPLVMLYIVVFGLLMKRPVYDDFVRGAKEGAKTVAGILPTLVGLMVGVGVLRSSGFMDAAAGWLGQWTQKAGFPSQLLPVAVVKLFSSSAATGLALDIFKQYGPDSELGLITYRNRVLHHEHLFSHRRHKKDKIHAAGGAACHLRGSYYERNIGEISGIFTIFFKKTIRIR